MKAIIANVTLVVLLILGFSIQNSWACGGQKVYEKSDHHALSNKKVEFENRAVEHGHQNMCPAMGNTKAGSHSKTSNSLQVIAVSQNTNTPYCEASKRMCNSSAVFLSLAIGLFIVLGSVSLFEKLKV